SPRVSNGRWFCTNPNCGKERVDPRLPEDTGAVKASPFSVRVGGELILRELLDLTKSVLPLFDSTVGDVDSSTEARQGAKHGVPFDELYGFESGIRPNRPASAAFVRDWCSAQVTKHSPKIEDAIELARHASLDATGDVQACAQRFRKTINSARRVIL